MTNHDAYVLGSALAYMEKLGGIPATLGTTLRQRSLWERLRALFQGAPKQRGIIPATQKAESRVFVDKYLSPELPTKFQGPAGKMVSAPPGKAVHETLQRRPAPPEGTLWSKSQEGGSLLASPQEPVAATLQHGNLPPAMSDRFEGWAF